MNMPSTVRKLFLTLAFALLAAPVLASYQSCRNGIGDERLVTMDGYSLSRSKSIDLEPTDMTSEDTRFSVRCRIAYVDRDMSHPRSNDEMLLAIERGDQLNVWLESFVREEYARATCDELESAYFTGAIADDLNERFPEYVRMQMASLDRPKRFDVRIVVVEIESEGALFEALVRRLSAREPVRR